MRSIFVFCIISSQLLSQGKQEFNISGKLINEKNQTVSFANIKLFSEDSKLVKAVKSDIQGSYLMKASSGIYKLEISFLGYKKIFKSVQVSTSNIDLGKIRMTSNTAKLSSVLVKGLKTSKASAIDKKEYKPSQLLNSQNASAAELISVIPSVTMGNEGNTVSFRGDGNVAVMINGKISTLTGQNLSQIPASSIEKVEVISVPNAKYISEGSAGIINVVLKKANKKYNGGFVLASIGNNNKYNAQIGYNFNLGKLAVTSSYNYDYRELWFSGWSKREYLDNTNLNSYRHSQNGESYNRIHSLRLGMDYDIDKRRSISFSGALSKDWGSSYSIDNDTFRRNTGDMYSQWQFRSFRADPNLIYDLNLAYSHWMPNLKDKWTIEFSRSMNMNDKTAYYEQDFVLREGLVSNFLYAYSVDNLQRRPITAFQTDYSYYPSSKNQIETGIRFANKDFRFTTSFLENSIEVPEWTNDFTYDENTYSLYGLWSSDWTDKLSSKLGLRLEQTNSESFDYDSTLVSYDYFYAFPSALFRYQTSKDGYISAAYSMRINRPGPGQLNPLQYVADPVSKILGNPEIKPEIINSYELAYGNDVNDKFSFSSSLYYKVTNNSITRFLSPNADGTFDVKAENIGKLAMTGWELIGSYKWSKVLNFNFSSNLSYNNLIYTSPMGIDYESDYIRWQSRGMLTIKLPWDLDAQVIAFYRSPFNSPQGTIQFMSSVDVSLRKKVLKKKGLFVLSVFDIFDDRKFAVNNSDVGFINRFQRKRETRYFNLSFRYNFGKESSSPKSKGSSVDSM